MALPTNLVESGCQPNVNSVLPYQVYRRILRQCAASICHSIGFDSAQKGSLEALSFLFHQFFSKTCQSSRKLCEHTGRSLVNAGDVLMAMVNEGRPELADFDTFLDTVKHSKPHTFSLLPQSPTKASPVLRISDPRPHPSYYPNFLPPFPDSHTYIRTEVRDETDTNYERVRRLDAQNKRDWEESLVRYAITQFPTVCVFSELDARLMLEAKDAIERQRAAFRLHRRHSNKQLQQKGQGQCPSMPTENGVGEAQKAANEPPPVGHGTAAGAGGGGQVPTAERGPEEIVLPSTEDDEEEEVVLPDTDKDGTTTGGETADIQIAGASTPPKMVAVGQNNNNNSSSKNNGIGAVSPSTSGPTTLEELLVEELSHPLESERSYVRIPHFCYILLPFDEPRPYLSALLTDDADQTVDDEQHNDDYFARILSKEMDEDVEEDGAMEGGEEGGGGGAGGRNSTAAMEL
ncbi:hypothetical protein niasHS_000946 [Heterodera schachtii]|uniref:Transcription initiation factor TFIID subunit 8 n=1 Tax=Heterodera schachtii TaxID=97005 RepID=A0ABD2K7S6_HETSC